MTRRSFLKGSVLLSASIAFVIPGPLFGQEPEKPKDRPDENKGGDNTDSTPKLETKLDSRGIPYQDCPECGAKMYKDDGKTWVCEQCGYSYVE